MSRWAPDEGVSTHPFRPMAAPKPASGAQRDTKRKGMPMLAHIAKARTLSERVTIITGKGKALIVGQHYNEAGQCPLIYVGSITGYFPAATDVFAIVFDGTIDLPKTGTAEVRGTRLYFEGGELQLDPIRRQLALANWAEAGHDNIPEPRAIEITKTRIVDGILKGTRGRPLILRFNDSGLSVAGVIEEDDTRTEMKRRVLHGAMYPTKYFDPLEIKIDSQLLKLGITLGKIEKMLVSTTKREAPVCLCGRDFEVYIAPMRAN